MLLYSFLFLGYYYTRFCLINLSESFVYFNVSTAPMFLFLVTFMVTVAAIIHGEYWNNLHPLAVDNIAMKTTFIVVFVYS